jgi:amino acid adenylation domain-containing protein
MPLLDAHVARHAAQRPEAEAVTDGSARMSYRELNAAADRVARRLGDHGVGHGDMVLVSMTRSVRTLAAIIGVLRVGAVYVPLEVRTPPARRRQIVEDCRPRAALCDPKTARLLCADEDLAKIGAPVLAVDDDAGQDGTGNGPATREAPAGSDDDLACVLYTSGSTGRPKGVMLSHRNVHAYATWAVERVGITSDDRILSTAPFYFDMSLFDLFCGLCAGGTVCIATERVLLFPKLLMEFAEGERVTVWKGVSSLLRYLSTTGALAPDRLPTMRVVLFGGEALPAKILRHWMTTFPDKVFYNFFGPTEATGASMYHRVPRAPASADEIIPIGQPRENTTLYLLDDDRQPVAPGEVGEIAVSGVCIAHGYLADPERTARVFLDDPWRPGQRMYLTGDLARRREDGTHVFMGRRDTQVKVMGYRLELGDIENALTAIEGVVEAGVLVSEPGLGGVEELVAYVVLTGSKPVAKVQGELRSALPFYMLPRHIHPIDRLPRSERGKIDRQALLAHHRAQAATP